MTRTPTLQIKETNKFIKVRDFLDSIDSEQTKRSYGIALAHFQTFLSTSQYRYNIESILRALLEKEIDVYELLKQFVSYLRLREDTQNNNTKLSRASIKAYVAAVRYYLETNYISIIPRIFKNQVKLPKTYKRSPHPLNAKDIQTILQNCSNVRLKVFIWVLASSGMRAGEALSLRSQDVYFDESPTRIHIRAEYTKTGQDRDVFISDEASKELKKFIELKPGHLIFTKKGDSDLTNIYRRFHINFTRVLKKIEMDERKDGEGTQRRKISFHSLRRFVKTQISKHAGEDGSDFSEVILGHTNMKTTYYSDNPDESGELYKKCMKYLTFLDIRTIESVGQDFEAKLEARDQEVQQLREYDKERDKEITDLKKTLDIMQEERKFLTKRVEQSQTDIIEQSKRVEELQRMWLEAMAGHVVMEGDWDEKQGKFIQGKHREMIAKKKQLGSKK